MGRDWSTGATSFVIFVNFCSTTYYFLKCPQKISPQLQLLKQVKFDLFWKVLPSLFCALVHCVVLALTLCYSVLFCVTLCYFVLLCVTLCGLGVTLQRRFSSLRSAFLQYACVALARSAQSEHK